MGEQVLSEMQPESNIDGIFLNWIAAERSNVLRTLFEYLSIDTSGQNQTDCFPFLEKCLQRIGGESFRYPFPAKLKEHPLRSRHPSAREDSSCFNLRGELKSLHPEAGTILFNSHVDVVPASVGMKDAFLPSLDEGRVFARGACDTKGNTIMLLETLRFMQECNMPIYKNVLFDFVVQEEIGGNGALASALNGIFADAVICLEPTNLQIYCGHRGCLTLDIKMIRGSTHMGESKKGGSAIDSAYKVIERLAQLEDLWNSESKKIGASEGVIWLVDLNLG